MILKLQKYKCPKINTLYMELGSFIFCYSFNAVMFGNK